MLKTFAAQRTNYPATAIEKSNSKRTINKSKMDVPPMNPAGNIKELRYIPITTIPVKPCTITLTTNTVNSTQSTPVGAPILQLMPATNINLTSAAKSKGQAVAILSSQRKNIKTDEAAPVQNGMPYKASTQANGMPMASISVTPTAEPSPLAPLPLTNFALMAPKASAAGKSANDANLPPLITSNLNSTAPIILSKTAVDHLYAKLNRMNANKQKLNNNNAPMKNNPAAVILTKPFKSGSNSNNTTINTNNNNNNISNNNITNKNNSKQSTNRAKSNDIMTTTQKETVEKPKAPPVRLINPNSVPTVTINGNKILKIEAAVAPAAAMTKQSLKQPSDSVAQAVDKTEKLNTANVAPSQPDAVATQIKKELPTVIDTITILDDDDEDSVDELMPSSSLNEREIEAEHANTPCPPTSTIDDADSSSSSDVEEIFDSPKEVAKDIITNASQSVKEQLPIKPASIQADSKASSMPTMQIVKAESLPVSTDDFENSLQCEEVMISVSSSSTTSTPPSISSCKSLCTSTPTISLAPFARMQCDSRRSSSSSSTLSSEGRSSIVPTMSRVNYKQLMRQSFHMMEWQFNDRATMQNSKMCFELNHFNLIQLTERCEGRVGPASYFERSLSERIPRRPIRGSDPLLYLCKRCNCHGPASDFLAPRFCSLQCVRRRQKRRHSAQQNTLESKMSRLSPSLKESRKNLQSKTKPPFTTQQSQKQKKRSFRWTEYLKIKGNEKAAPIHLFLNPFPINQNYFERNMKVEAIDPENCSLFCVCTIVEVQGYRLKLHFDGYSTMYDFWVNADSMDIFPPGWCQSTNRVLQPPKDYINERFNWSRYVVKTKSKAASRDFFTHLNMAPQIGLTSFSIGMHLEAEDLNDTGKICVATVADIIGERIRVHFDGWDDCYDFWVHVSSPYIHPCGWHQGRQQLIVPPDFQNAVFNWDQYIRDTGGIAAPVDLFMPREPMEFQPRMKLEVVDQRNPCLIRPATVVTRKGYRIQLHLDCWPTEYYFWMEDDSPDLHPIGWCEATMHELESPPGYTESLTQMSCEIEGCRGLGNAKRFNLDVHAQRDCCPYAPDNWRQWRAKTVKPPRVTPDNIIVKMAKTKRRISDISQHNEPRVAQKYLKMHAEPMKSDARSWLLTPIPAEVERRTNKLKRESPITLKSSSIKIEKDGELHIEDTQAFAELNETMEEEAQMELEQESSAVSSSLLSRIPSVEQKKTLFVGSDYDNVDPRSLPIAKAFVAEYGPQFIRNYLLWQKNSEFDLQTIKSNPLYWTMWDVYEYVERALQSQEIAKVIFDEEIDGRALLMLGRDDLTKYLKLKIGPAVKLFSIIVNLRIAVVCKFDTKMTGLNIFQADTKEIVKKPYCESIDGAKPKPAIDVNNINRKKSVQEEDDEDDVVLDNEDFLNVKPLTTGPFTKRKQKFVACLNDGESGRPVSVFPNPRVPTAS